MTSGTTYETNAMRPRSPADVSANRSRRRRHHALRYGPAERGSFARRGRSATTADTTGARTISGGRSDLGVDEAIGDIDHQIRHNVGARGEQDDPLHERVVFLEDRVDRELPDALPREDRLDDDAAREQPADLQSDDRHNGDERVPQGVAQDDETPRQPLRARGGDVFAPEHLQQRRAREPRDESRALVSEHQSRQDETVEAARAGGGEPPQRYREQEDEQHRECEARKRHAGEREDHHQPVDRAIASQRRDDPNRYPEEHAEEK